MQDYENTTPEGNTGPVFSVLIADPHLVVAETICAILIEKRDCTAKGVDSLEAAIAASAQQSYDLFLYDWSLAGCYGLDRLKHIVAAFPDTAVVLFGTCGDPVFLTSAMKSGLRGYVPKSLPLNRFLPTVDLLMAGELFLPSEMVRTMGLLGSPVPVKTGMLKDIDRRILGMIDAGLSNSEIGLELATSENQIKMKLRTLYSKIGANNRIHAVRIARELGEL